MKLIVSPSKINGDIQAPPSKSYTHRELILSALSNEPSEIQNPLLSDDTITTISAIKAFGATVTVNEKENKVFVSGGKLKAPDTTINCNNSGTTLRIITSIASHITGTTRLSGDQSLSKRPMKELLDALSNAGASVSSNEGKLPVSVSGPLVMEDISIRGDISSQFISGILIAAPLSSKDIRVHLKTKLTSAPYVAMTMEAMKSHGVIVDKTEDGFLVKKGQKYHGVITKIPGDFSSAAIILVAGALCGSVTISGLDSSNAQGDKAILTILKKFHATIEETNESITVKKSNLSAADINLSESPDLFPIAAVLAANATGTSHLFGAQQLAFKESNRILTTTEFLKAMGADVVPTNDGCIIQGGKKLHGANIISYNDHRIAMSAAIAGLAAEGETTIDDISCASVSYPDFVKKIKSLGAQVEEIK